MGVGVGVKVGVTVGVSVAAGVAVEPRGRGGSEEQADNAATSTSV
jgi:hypothetical protein